MAPPSMNILNKRSSARMSYIAISPEAKPTPTTSIAGDWIRAVTGLGDVEDEDVV
jgi:hypothetical protein